MLYASKLMLTVKIKEYNKPVENTLLYKVHTRNERENIRIMAFYRPLTVIMIIYVGEM